MLQKKDPEACLNTLFWVKEKGFPVEYWYLTEEHFVILNENEPAENQIRVHKKGTGAYTRHIEIISGRRLDLEIEIRQDSIKTLLRSPSRLIRLWARQERYT